MDNYSDFQSQVCSWVLFELNFGEFIMGCFALLMQWFSKFFCIIIFLNNLILIVNLDMHYGYFVCSYFFHCENAVFVVL